MALNERDNITIIPPLCEGELTHPPPHTPSVEVFRLSWIPGLQEANSRNDEARLAPGIILLHSG